MPRKKAVGGRTKSRPVDGLADSVAMWWERTFVYANRTQIATWKGLLLIMFIVGSVAAFVWSIETEDYVSVKAAPSSTLSFAPSAMSTTVGSGFSMAAVLNPGTNAVNAIELHITFDPTRLRLDGVTPGTAFPLELQAPRIDNMSGTASISLGAPLSSPSVTMTSTVATFAFTALSAGTDSPVTFTAASAAAADGELSDVVLTRIPGTVTVNLGADATPPLGGSITYPNGSVSALSVVLTVADGTDVSGVDTGSRRIERRSAPLSRKSCGTYGSYMTITPIGTYPDFTDTTVTNSTCNQYRYLVSDMVGNQSISSSTNVAKVVVRGSGKPTKPPRQ